MDRRWPIAPLRLPATLATLLALLAWSELAPSAQAQLASARVGVVPQTVSLAWTVDDGLPSRDVRELAVTEDGRLIVATDVGLASFEDGRWSLWPELAGTSIDSLELRGPYLYLAAANRLWWLSLDGRRQRALGITRPVSALALGAGLPPELWLGTEAGIERNVSGLTAPLVALPDTAEIREIATAVDHPASSRGQLVAIAADSGLYIYGSRALPDGWVRLAPEDGRRSWNPVDVRFVLFDPSGRLWFGSPQGLGVYDFELSRWQLLDERDGLPWSGFTSAAAAPDGSLWLGTDRGLVGWQDGRWAYRQGRRWLPDDRVIDVAVDAEGNVWVATAGGVALLRQLDLTLTDKASRFERDIERFHRRTDWGYVGTVELAEPGRVETFRQVDSDNDGLWTSMYGAAQCFAWAATGDPAARERARQAFEALRFLGTVTQGGRHSPPAGFVARSILPGDGPDPNRGTVARDRQLRAERDRNWKVIEPRWPKSAAGDWYWKSDTSSDELDGHFFFYALYHDLVAADPAERAEVAAVVTAIVDHLIEHDFSLVDHDGEPTRWAVFGPDQLNHDRDWWEERGLNSLSILAYLRIAEHVSGDSRYGEVARELIEDHAYAANVRVPKIHTGAGTGNQSDDEMAFMNFYHLIAYEQDPALREIWAHSFHRYWLNEAPERNPLFNFMWAARVPGLSYEDAFESGELRPPDRSWLDDAVDSLVRFPLDRLDWRLENSHRLDVELLPGSDPDRPRGHLRDGRVLPIDERWVEHWNHDPWRLDQGGNGTRLADGTAFLLPYYLGLYHGFLLPEEE